MNIGYICSDEYAKYAGISLCSLFEKNRKVTDINVFIFDNNISNDNKKKMEKISQKYKRKIFFVDGKGELQKILSNFETGSFRGVGHTYAKIFPFVFAKDIDKILVLDSDTIINQDLTEMYNTDISKVYFAAVPEITAWFKSSEDQEIIYKKKFYYNSGCLLCNLKRMRKSPYLNKIIKARENYKKPLKLADQSLINLSMNDEDILPLNFKYNYNINLNIFSELRTEVQKKYHEFGLGFIHKDFSQIAQAKDIAILHYLGAARPWSIGFDAPYATEWVKYFKRSPWKGDKGIRKKLKVHNILKTVQSGNCEKTKLLGITIKKKTPQKTSYLHGLFVKKKTPKYKKNYMFGIPVYYKKIQPKTMCIEQNIAELKGFIYQTMWLPQKVAELHKQVFPKFKNIHNGEDVVIVGCGPTLFHYTPLKNAKHISLNRAFRYEKINYDYAFIWDLQGMAQANDGCVEDFLNYDCTKFVGKFLSDKVAIPEVIENNNGKLYRCYSSARQGLGLPGVDPIIHADLTIFPLADFMSISFGALHFASWTNPKHIYLVGLDTAINGSFDGRQNPYHFNEMFMGYRLFKQFMQNHYPDTEIISINPIGLKGMFKYVYTQSYVDEHPELKDENVEILK